MSHGDKIRPGNYNMAQSVTPSSQLRIGIIGGGFAGVLYARELLSGLVGELIEVVVYEGSEEESTEHWTQPGSGAALNIGANGMATIREFDPEFYETLLKISYPRKQIKASSISTSFSSYDFTIPDIIASKLSDCYGCMSRWGDAVKSARSLCPRENIHFGRRVTSVDFSEITKTLTCCILANDQVETREFDFIIAADGRYSTIRKCLESSNQEEKEVVDFCGVYNFRLLIPDDSPLGILDDDLELLYNFPDTSNAQFGSMKAFNGLARAGIAKCPPSATFPNGSIYIFGNFSTEEGWEQAQECTSSDGRRGDRVNESVVKTSAFLKALYTPVGGEEMLTPKGRWLISVLERESHRLHWSRFQSIKPKFTTVSSSKSPIPVLYLGDAAHAFPPSLGQGATSAIEDGYAAAHTTLSELRSWDGDKDSKYSLIQRIIERFIRQRSERLELIKSVSIEAAQHILPDPAHPGIAGHRSQMKREVEAWTHQGGSFLSSIQRIWKGYPRKESQ